MTKEQDEQLCKEFPNLYKQRNGDMMSTAMCWGFECGSGWFQLIYDLSKALEAEILKLPEEDRQYSCASQVKEKYGTLRFYMHSETKEMSQFIKYYEHKSSKICEKCGKPGELRGYSWLFTACNEHSNDNLTNREYCAQEDKKDREKLSPKKKLKEFFIIPYSIERWFKYPKMSFDDIISDIKWKIWKFKYERKLQKKRDNKNVLS